MSLQVDFYLVSSGSDDALGRVACRIAEKAWQQGHRVYLLTDSAQAAADMDDLLWTFKQNSFVPHSRAGNDDDQCPVLVGDSDSLPPGIEVLVNMTASVPRSAEACARVADLVAGNAEARRAGRERYRHYRDAGAQLRTHEVRP